MTRKLPAELHLVLPIKDRREGQSAYAANSDGSKRPKPPDLRGMESARPSHEKKKKK